MFIVPISSMEPLQSAMKQGNAAAGQMALSGAPFADALSNAMTNLEQTQKVSQADAEALALGQTDDLHTMQINSIKAVTAIDMAAGVTSRVLGAYNEIMRMQV